MVAIREVKKLDIFEFFRFVDKSIEDGRRRANSKGR